MSARKSVCLFIFSFAITLGALVGIGLLAPLSPFADSVGHFKFHLAVLLLPSSLAILYLGYRKRGSILLLLSLIAFLTIDFTSGKISFSEEKRRGEITLLQLNLKYSNQSFKKISNLIKEHRPDILVLQEVSETNRKTIDSFAERYPHRVHCPFAAIGAVAVLSRLPVTDNDDHGCAVNEGLGWLRIKIEETEITIASLHLHWPYPFGQDKQIKALKTILQGLPQPVILAGDFNAAPWSHAVTQIAKATNTQVVGGLRFTLQKSLFRGLIPIRLPIDHLLTPKNIAIREIMTGANVGSDHLPVISRLVLNAS